ncbi:MAG: hypothetical protein ACQESK_05575 [Bacteroidota bacterium]
MIKKTLTLVLCSMLFYSCSSELNESETLQETYQKNRPNLDYENDVKKEMTLLVSRVLNSKNARQEATDFIKVVDSIYHRVSISALLNQQQNLAYVETENLKHLGIHSLNHLLPNEYFKSNLLYEIRQSGLSNYPTLLEGLDIERSSDGEIVDKLISYDLSMFFPELNSFDWPNLSRFRSTFIPSTENGENESLEIGTVEVENDDDLIECTCHPTSPGGLHLAEGHPEYSSSPTVTIEDTSHDPWDSTYGGEFGDGSDGGGGTPDPISNQPVLLDYNFDYSTVATPSLLTSGVPRVQVKDSWRRWGSSSTRLRIYRVKSNFSVNSDGEIVPSSDTFMHGYNPSRYATKNKRWRYIHMEWDPEIKKEEASQQIVIFQQRRGASSSTATVNTKNNLDENGEFSTTVETSVSHTINHNQSKFRGSKELSLLNLSVYNINGNPHLNNETYNHNGVEQSVNNVSGNFNYFFEFYYTNLN